MLASAQSFVVLLFCSFASCIGLEFIRFTCLAGGAETNKFPPGMGMAPLNTPRLDIFLVFLSLFLLTLLWGDECKCMLGADGFATRDGEQVIKGIFASQATAIMLRREGGFLALDAIFFNAPAVQMRPQP
ncbi:hypothetical protein K456DRAFT_668066 [Colletotrichum gloeosporioides 23]|nr:hypothetical protein K456DRAFT_668066 [Colletotrichum gloeosporioides 23]